MVESFAIIAVLVSLYVVLGFAKLIYDFFVKDKN